MKKLLVGMMVLVTFSTFADCTKQVEEKVISIYPFPETLTMEIKNLGTINHGDRFTNNRTPKFEAYSIGTSDEGGGVLYLASVDSEICEVVNLNKVTSKDD